jgi:hypothetical protein
MGLRVKIDQRIRSNKGTASIKVLQKYVKWHKRCGSPNETPVPDLQNLIRGIKQPVFARNIVKVNVVNTNVTFLLAAPAGNQTKNTQMYYAVYSLTFLSVCALDRAVKDICKYCPRVLGSNQDTYFTLFSVF